MRFYVKSVTPNTWRPPERAHHWGAMLVFAGFELLVIGAGVAIVVLAGRGK